MEEKYTIDEFIIVIKRLFDYIGPDMLHKLLIDNNPPQKKLEEKTSDELLEEINNFKGKI